MKTTKLAPHVELIFKTNIKVIILMSIDLKNLLDGLFTQIPMSFRENISIISLSNYFLLVEREENFMCAVVVR
jgi:hypothetical protein